MESNKVLYLSSRVFIFPTFQHKHPHFLLKTQNWLVILSDLSIIFIRLWPEVRFVWRMHSNGCLLLLYVEYSLEPVLYYFYLSKQVKPVLLHSPPNKDVKI